MESSSIISSVSHVPDMEAAKDRMIISASSLPDVSATEMDFLDTSFFKSSGLDTPKLPSPDEVRKASPGMNIVMFPHLNLVVKFSFRNRVPLEEALAMRAVKLAFPNNEVPVPELFGWRIVGDEHFIYMSLIQGLTLRAAWPSLNQEDKVSISSQLARIVAHLRLLKQDSQSPFIGAINQTYVRDFYCRVERAGPFRSVREFNDWVQRAADPTLTPSEEPEDPYRKFLPDTCGVYFSHADLNLTNIIVSENLGSYTIAGIIDWEQAGWYPEYWEYCKLILSEHYDAEWRVARWTDKIVGPHRYELMAIGNYWKWKCP